MGDAKFHQIVEVVRAKKVGDQWSGHCPAHDDANPSLSLQIGADQKILWKCHTGCSQEAVRDALKKKGVSFAVAPSRSVQSEFLYQDTHFQDQLKVVRIDSPGREKRIYQQRKSGDVWENGGSRVDLLPYRYGDWKDQSVVYLVEGEKCAEAIISIGLCGTTTVGGCGKWMSRYAQYFVGKTVVIIPDNDEPGMKYARSALSDLSGAGVEVLFLELPGLSANEDVFDWISHGGTRERLEDLVLSIPKFEPSSSVSKSTVKKELICLEDVEAREVTWLWKPYLPVGKLVLIEGDPGVGKSWLTMTLAASISQGAAVHGGHAFEKGTVIVFSAEDDPADTLKPRLLKMNADMSQLFVYPHALDLDEEGIALVDRFVAERKPTIVIIDPIQAYMGKHDMNKANETRSILAPLAEIAQRHSCTILVVRHLKKGIDKSTYRGMGSIDILAAVRSVLLVGCDPKNKAQKAIIHNKSNLSEPGPTIGYKIENGTFVWTGEIDLTAGDLLALDLDRNRKGGPSKLSDAVEFLATCLADGPRLADEVEEEAEMAGVSERTLKRAKQKMKVRSFRQGHEGWSWILPSVSEAGQAGHVVEPNVLALFPLKDGN